MMEETSVSITPEALSYRLSELRWTIYRLAKEYSAVVGTNSPATKYHTSLTKTLANPEISKLATISNLVNALKGRVVIIWDDVPEEEKGSFASAKSTEERLELLEDLLNQVMHKLQTM